MIGVRTQGRPGPGRAGRGRRGRLTLVTAVRGAGVGGLQASQTVYVDADAGRRAPSPPARSPTADIGTQLMSAGVDTTTLALLALGLQLLVAALVGFVWAWSPLVAAGGLDRRRPLRAGRAVAGLVDRVPAAAGAHLSPGGAAARLDLRSKTCGGNGCDDLNVHHISYLGLVTKERHDSMLDRRKTVGAAFVALATASTLALSLTPAEADFSPQPNDVVSTGFDIIQNSFNFLADGYHELPGYNTAGNRWRFVNFDSSGDAQGRSAFTDPRLLPTITGNGTLGENGVKYIKQSDVKLLNPTISLRAGQDLVVRPTGGGGGGRDAIITDDQGWIDVGRSPDPLNATHQNNAQTNLGTKLIRVQIATDRQLIATATTTNAPATISAAGDPQDLQRRVHQVGRDPRLLRRRRRRDDHPADPADRRRHVEHLRRQRRQAEPGRRPCVTEHAARQPEQHPGPAERPDRDHQPRRGRSARTRSCRSRAVATGR